MIVTLGVWYRSLGSISVATVATPKVEAFYWITITFSQTLGTALGDWTADSGLGYNGGAMVFAAGLAALVALYFRTNISRVFLFWAAFILTRPLGATVGDFLDKPVHDGGLALSRPLATACHRRFHHRLNSRPAAAGGTASGTARNRAIEHDRQNRNRLSEKTMSIKVLGRPRY